MFIRPCYRKKNGKRHAYWALVESYRTQRGPRQRTVAYLGMLDQKQRLGVKNAAQGNPQQNQKLLLNTPKAQYVQVDPNRVRVERCRNFGDVWLGLELVRKLQLDQFLENTLPQGRAEIPWSTMALVLVLCRLCDPSSELHIAEHLRRHSALADLLGVSEEKINDDRLYRALDALLPHKNALETFLKNRLGKLFDLKYDLLLYDVTSTYFEGKADGNKKAKRGYSRDHRSDCKQVCIGLVVSKCGMPLGYEVFAGNRRDVTTLQEIVQIMEARYGKAERIWAMDRGMVSDENMEFLQAEGRRYIVGTPKSMLKKFERELLSEDWNTIRPGLDVKLCGGPQGDEVFILCRSQDRGEKENAMLARFEDRLEEGLRKIEQSCAKRKHKVSTIAKRLGRLLQKNSRAAKLFKVDVAERADGGADLEWSKDVSKAEWASLSNGCYILRSNVLDWSAQELWEAYIQLNEAESAFRIQKNDLRIRPIWHQKQERVEAHILVCFLGYVLWKTLGQLCKAGELGNEPRRVLEEVGRIKLVDVILPTREGVEIRRRCVTHPTDHQAILLERLGLNLPTHLKMTEM